MSNLKKVPIGDIFHIRSTMQGNRISFKESTIYDPCSAPFLGRSGLNNGIVSYVTGESDKLNGGRIITIALDGSTGSTFYQHHPFYCGQNIWELHPNLDAIPEFDPFIAIYLVTTLRMAVKNYSYSLSLTKSRLSKVKVIVPVTIKGEIDVKGIRGTVKELRNSNILNHIPSNRIF